MAATGGGEAFMVRSLLHALTSIAQPWYLGLEPRSMYSWEQLREKLHCRFQGYKSEEMTTTDLNNVSSMQI